jgi:chorismate mutase
MKKDFLIVSRKILPDYLDKVIYARNLLVNHEASTITEAVQIAGISRNTYYKYKDYVYESADDAIERKAVISLILKNESGTLSSVLKTLTDLNTSILTISQAIPIAGKANVLVSLDISKMACEVEEMVSTLKKQHGVRNVHLDAIE